MKNDVVLIIVVAVFVAALTGCNSSENEHVARVATEAADRQAGQNQEMSRLNREVAEGTKKLVESDANARRELISAQEKLHAQQAEIGQQRDQLEQERKEIARQRQTASLLAPVLDGLGILLFGGLVIGLCWCLLHGLKSDAKSSQELSDLLILELAAGAPTLLPADDPVDPDQTRLNPRAPAQALPSVPNNSGPQP